MAPKPDEDPLISEVQHKIDREKRLISGATSMRQSTNNPAVRAQADNQIRDGRRNIEYLEGKMRELQLKREGRSNGGSQGPGGSRSGNKSGSHPSQYGNADYGDPPGGNYSNINVNTGMPPRAPFPPGAPGSPTTRARPNYSRLDLIKHDTQYLGPRIQMMLSQLQFKVNVEEQYKEGIEKIMQSYAFDGDKRIRQEAYGKRQESIQKLQLLGRALKRYEDLYVDMESADAADDDSLNVPSMRKPLTGRLSLRIHAVADVDHAATGRLARGPETFVVMKVEDEFKGRTKATRTDKWIDELHEINIDKGNEIELTVYDKIGGDQASRPIGMLWMRLSDINEEMRRKKVEMEVSNSGWVSADRTVDEGQIRPDLQFQPPPGQQQSSQSNFAGAPGLSSGAAPQTGPVIIESWFSLEPVGRLHLSLSFNKETRERKPFEAVGLNRKGAIRQPKGDVHELYGHKFVPQQFYNIMKCALCAEFLKYATGMQCSDCKYLCHDKCYPLVVTKCISKSNAESDPDEAKLNHRIPHRFEVYNNMGANWCCHCGYILPLGRKNTRRCKECKLFCHAQCTHLVPDFCGMSMTQANQILRSIKEAQQHQMSVKTFRAQPKQRPAAQQKPSYSQSSEESRAASKDRFSYGNEAASDSSPRASDASLGAAKQSFNAASTPPPSAQQARRPPPPDRTGSSSIAAAAAAASALATKTSPTEQKPPYSRQGSYPTSPDRSSQAPPTPQHAPYDPSAYAAVDRPGYGAPRIMSPQPTPQIKQPYMPPPPEKPQPQPTIAPQTPVVQSQPGSITSFVERKGDQQRDKGTGRRIGLDHFNFLAVLGKGNFGKVMLAETKQSKQLYAIKVLKKEFIIENDEVESTKSERDVFIIANRARHPFLLSLHACFQTETRVYFVMEYISGGDLMLHIQRGQFGSKRAQFYAAEVCLALKYFHENGVIYRDLKLDNIMLTLDGHIKIADYGLCKKDMYYGSSTKTFCGTPEFMAPEILLDRPYGRAVDWWAFGVLIYQMLLQQSPFRGEDEDEIYDAILADEPLYPIAMPKDSVSLLQKLLTREPELRLGSGPTDAQEIMSHAFFRNINWDDIYNKSIAPPFQPQIKSPTDTSNFDPEFTSVTPVLTPVNSVLTAAMQEEFRGFSYSADFT